jgi:hypothetical protein
MKIQLSNPCTIDPSKIINGYCSECSKNVVDYSGMNDSQMLAHISKNGLGCGTWREDQLGRPLTPKRGNLKYMWISILLLWLLPFNSKAQTNSDSTQIAYNTTAKRFGTGNISTIKRYKTYGFYWKGIKIRILKFRVKSPR